VYKRQVCLGRSFLIRLILFLLKIDKFVSKLQSFMIYYPQGTVLQGGLTQYSYGMEVMPMRNHFDFKDIMTFGLFLLALLTFVFTFCK